MTPISSTSQLPPDCFARQISERDIGSFFHKQFTVDTGFTAIVVDNGRVCANLGPGTYTIASLQQQMLSLIRDRQCTLVLARSDEQACDFDLPEAFTRENVAAQVRGCLTVQMEDLSLFLQHVLGHRPTLHESDLTQFLSPQVTLAVSQVIGDLSLVELTGPTARESVAAYLAAALDEELKRIGLRFGTLRTLAVKCEVYDRLRQTRGEDWLAGLKAEGLRKRHELELDERHESARFQGRMGEIAQLRRQADLQTFSQETENRIARVKVYQQLQQVLQSADLERLTRADERAALIGNLDLHKVLREQELTRLAADFAIAHDNRAQAARRIEDRAQCELDCAVAEMRHQLEQRRWQSDFDQTRQRGSWELDHKAREGQIAIDQEARRSAIALDRARTLTESAVSAEAATAKLLLEAQAAQAQQQLRREAAETDNRIRLLQTLRGGTELEFITAANPEQARLLAEFAMNRDQQTANVKIAEAQSNQTAAVNAEAARLHATHAAEVRHLAAERVADQKENSRVAAQLARDAIQSAGNALGGAMDAVTMGGASGAAGGRVICTKCRTANAPVSKRCSQCGQEL